MVAPRDEPLYTRALPGGGFVSIEAWLPLGDLKGAVHRHDIEVHARLFVERRADPVRRVGHVPPVVAESVAPTLHGALNDLYDIAADNVEVARAIQRWQTHRRPYKTNSICS